MYYAVQATENVAGGLAPCSTTRPEVAGIACVIPAGVPSVGATHTQLQPPSTGTSTGRGPLTPAHGGSATELTSEARHLRLVPVAQGRQGAVAFVEDPAHPGTFLLVAQDGRVDVFRDGAIRDTPFLDLRDEISREGNAACWGWPFHPMPLTRCVFVNFTDREGHTVIARFARRADNLLAAPESRFDLQWGDGGVHPAALFEPQRRPPGVRPRWLSVHRPRRRRLGQRSPEPRAVADDAARQDAPHRRRRAPDDPRGYVVPADNLSSAWKACSRDLGARLPESVAIQRSTTSARRYRRARGRRRRPGTARRDRLRARRRRRTELWVASSRGLDGHTRRAAQPVGVGPLVEPLFDYGRGRGSGSDRRLRLSRIGAGRLVSWPVLLR